MKQNGHELDISSFGKLHNADGTPSVLVSGSTMVQTVLGVLWREESTACETYSDDWAEPGTVIKSNIKRLDLDIFCAPQAAAAVRTQLVADGYLLSGLPNNNAFSEIGAGTEAHLLENKVHHVECYANYEDYKANRDEFADSNTDEERLEYGKNPLPSFAHLQSMNHGEFTPFRASNAHEVQCLPSNPALPFDFYSVEDKSVDLVLGETRCR
jgi:hypothetical protein